jgi:hypothetical protein
MPLVKATEMMNSLVSNDEFFAKPGIACWLKGQGKINIYIFSAVYQNEEELVNNFREIRDHVAISFQSQTLDKLAERWNLYLFYFVKDEVSYATKEKVTQDKFSTRKIVCSGFDVELTDAVIAARIDNELFDFAVYPKQAATGTLDELMAAKFPLVQKALNQLSGADTREAIPSLLKILNDEQN